MGSWGGTRSLLQGPCPEPHSRGEVFQDPAEPLVGLHMYCVTRLCTVLCWVEGCRLSVYVCTRMPLCVFWDGGGCRTVWKYDSDPERTG